MCLACDDCDYQGNSIQSLKWHIKYEHHGFNCDCNHCILRWKCRVNAWLHMLHLICLSPLSKVKWHIKWSTQRVGSFFWLNVLFGIFLENTMGPPPPQNRTKLFIIHLLDFYIQLSKKVTGSLVSVGPLGLEFFCVQFWGGRGGYTFTGLLKRVYRESCVCDPLILLHSFSTVCFHKYPQISCREQCIITLFTFLNCSFLCVSNVSNLIFSGNKQSHSGCIWKDDIEPLRISGFHDLKIL